MSPKKGLTLLTTTLQVNTSNGYDLPQRVMATAVTLLNASTKILEIHWTLKPPTSKFYLYMHFAELQSLQANETREFDVTMNGNVTTESYSPKFFKMQTLYSITPRQCDGGECLLQLVKTSSSTLPPLINAIEVFTVIDFSQFETNGDEGIYVGFFHTYKLLNYVNMLSY